MMYILVGGKVFLSYSTCLLRCMYINLFKVDETRRLANYKTSESINYIHLISSDVTELQTNVEYDKGYFIAYRLSLSAMTQDQSRDNINISALIALRLACYASTTITITTTEIPSFPTQLLETTRTAHPIRCEQSPQLAHA